MVKKAKNKDGENLDTGFNPKYAKLIAHIISVLEAMPEDELKKTIIDSEKSISEVEKDIEADEHLKALKDEIKDIVGSYSEVNKVMHAKIRYCVHLLNSRGNI